MIALTGRGKPYFMEGDELFVSGSGHAYSKDRRGRLSVAQGRVAHGPSHAGSGALTALGEAILHGGLPATGGVDQ